ncbi:Rpn family recombination-promoting nuclease/putative transposase, partial [Longibaculum muris]|uniref:Rpn family recombination-promoting nuclease/putative transposase n=1 Tax=Longibaculum muris TaxID=1796628 RepID=UPI003AB3717D
MLNCKADPTLKDYFRDKVHFADFLNGIYFSGRQVLSPEHLSVVDTDMSTVVEGKKGAVSFNRNRDVIMKDNQNGIYVLNAIENQKAIDYTMPVRVFVYDALMYNQQLKQLKKKKGKKKVKLEPVMTSVIYYGERSWSGPRCLSDMMKIPKEYKGMINDWDARIIDIKD